MSTVGTTSALGWDNKFTTTLSSGITASDTTIPLTNLPNSSQGFLVIEPDSSTAWEEIFYTSKTGSAVVCPDIAHGRGAGGSSAASHSQGATVRMDTTAEMFEALQDGTALAAGAVGAQNLSNPYKFRVNRTAAYNTANAVATRMPYDTKDFDTSSNVDIVTNPGRFTAPVAGFYQFNARWGTGSASSNINRIALYKNGSEVSRGVVLQYTANPMGNTVSDILQLSANDFVEVFYFSNGVVTADVGTAFNYFSGFLVSAT